MSLWSVEQSSRMVTTLEFEPQIKFNEMPQFHQLTNGNHVAKLLWYSICGSETFDRQELIVNSRISVVFWQIFGNFG